MTTFDARPQAATCAQAPEWLLPILLEGRRGPCDEVFRFHELSTFEPVCVASARRFVDRTLTSWGSDGMVFDAQLVVSELVTNAMRHGGGAIQLRLLSRRPEVACVVSDYSRHAPTTPPTTDVFAEYGRGLRLVEALTTTWGWLTPGTQGKLVWAVLSS
ncbi:ATP-binding protein [Nonomuraea sp. NPDC052129]|uniref:ATP-binding protein n=1 Tax=Nonomuraea sp. NPDC052129 TaxID=3154651 RepID=UPI00341288A6